MRSLLTRIFCAAALIALLTTEWAIDAIAAWQISDAVNVETLALAISPQFRKGKTS